MALDTHGPQTKNFGFAAADADTIVDFAMLLCYEYKLI
jgi:hypothetical protein